MKQFIILGAALLLLAVLPSHARAFGWKDVIQMHQDSISDELILEKIQHGGKAFHLDADDLRELKHAGISDKVITAMLRTEDTEDDYGPGYQHPYVGAYPYYNYPYYGSRLSLNFGFGGGGYRGYGYGGGHGGWSRGHGGYPGGGGHHGHRH